MHAFELVKQAKENLEKIQKSYFIIDIAYKISKAFKNINSNISSLSANIQNQIPTNISNIQGMCQDVVNTLAPVSPREVFKNIEHLSITLREIAEEESANIDTAELALEALEVLSQKYESFISTHQITKVPPLAHASLEFLRRYETITDSYLYVIENLGNSDTQLEDENLSEFSLYLSNVSNLKDFAEKLYALSELYEEIASLLDVNTTDQPLIIDQIESGSLWSKLFGEPRVIGLMVDLLQKSASYIYKNYTTEGQISAIPAKLDSLDKILDFSERLREKGVDTEEIHENLRRSAVAISRDLNKLVENQPIIEVNGEKQSIASEVMKSLTGDSWQRPRLAHQERKEPQILPPLENE